MNKGSKKSDEQSSLLNSDEQEAKERKRLAQTDVPSYSLEQALRVPRAIGENYAFGSPKPLDVAAALDMSPGSSSFRMLCNAATAYGLTMGSYKSSGISVTDVGRRIIEDANGDGVRSKREAILKPRIIRELLTQYNGHKLPPREDIIHKVLLKMGVPEDSLKRAWGLIQENAKSVGFLRTIKDGVYVDLQGVSEYQEQSKSEENSQGDESDDIDLDEVRNSVNSKPELFRVDNSTGSKGSQNGIVQQVQDPRDSSRVFITHGKNRSFVEPLKVLLSHGGLESVVAAEQETVSQPVPDKVIDAMRSCSAAIIHVDAERTLIDPEKESAEVVLNSNVLIEIGAALALYGRRFILLVKHGINLPSNLQGLYQVRYNDDKLDFDTTIKLLSAIKDIKNRPLP